VVRVAQAVAEPLLREAFSRWWFLRHVVTPTDDQNRTRLAQRVVMAPVVCQRRGPEWPQAYARVAEILSRVVRASRAVECVKSMVRRHQARHRHVS
jgi:hypothetical protein